MDKNVFKNAYLGKLYKTRNERKAIYLGEIKEDTKPLKYILNIENFGSIKDTNSFLSDGTALGIDSMFDIVSEWQEEINEDELNALAFNSASPSLQNGIHSLKLYKDGFKAGYYKALENNYGTKTSII